MVRSRAWYGFKAVFESDESIGFGDLAGLRVSGPNGYAEQGVAMNVKSNLAGTRHCVTYRVMAPGGAFDAADNAATRSA
jgi:hypothetical protein